MLKWTFLLTLLALKITAEECPKLWLTVSSLWRSLPNEIIDSELEVNWKIDCLNKSISKKILLYDSDPTKNENVEPKLVLNISENTSGYYRTNMRVNKYYLPSGWVNEDVFSLSDNCLNHYAILHVNDSVLKSSCLKIRPTWMYDHRKQIGHLPISSLMIPGTHNSGCYYNENVTTLDIIMHAYTLTQDRDVWNQLIHGIRYLDLRVGWYSVNSSTAGSQDENFWINHDIFRIRPLHEVLKQIKYFLKKAKGEIVILDFHRFPVGLNGKTNRHRELISILERDFADLLIKPNLEFGNVGPTLNNIWTSGKQLIISYGDKNIANEYDFLWPPLTQAWGGKRDLNELLSYLNTTIMEQKLLKKKNNPLWALMAELTPNILDIVFQVHGKLRHLADDTNRALTLLFESNQTYCEKSNIVATDFFLGNNLIDISIKSNIEKGKKSLLV